MPQTAALMFTKPFVLVRGALLWALCAVWVGLAPHSAQAQAQPPLVLDLAGDAGYQVISAQIAGDAGLEYQFAAQAGQVISVDVQASGALIALILLPPEGDVPLAANQSVVDVTVPVDGMYRLHLALAPDAAPTETPVGISLGLALTAPEFADGLTGGPDVWVVTGLASSSHLNLRAGPDTRYPVVGILRAGSLLRNQGCRMSGAMRWCSVRTLGAGVTGWAAGQFLAEAGAQPAAPVSGGGPVGDGTPYDAAGAVVCQQMGQLAGQCAFGAVRDGPDQTRVWILDPANRERLIRFEDDVPVAITPAGGFVHAMRGDTHIVLINGLRLEIPMSVMAGP